MDFINQIYANLGRVVAERKQKREQLRKDGHEKLEMEDFIDFFLEAEALDVEDVFVSKFERSQFKASLI